MKMTKVRKLLAFTLAAGLMMSSMTAFAVPQSEWPTTFPGRYTGKDGTQGGVTSEYQGSAFYYHFYGSEPGSSELRGADGYLWSAENGNDYEWDGASGAWVLISSGSSYENAGEKAALEQKREAEERGFDNVEDMLDADSRNMSAAEWNNNAIINTPGMELSLPVSAGQGSVVIDGEKTNITPTMEKVDAAYADSIDREKDGLLLNVFRVSYPSTDDAQITFDITGVNADSEIAAYQYVKGVWTEVEVTEIRKDHVTLHLQDDGVIAFMLKPLTSFNWNRREGIAEWDYPEEPKIVASADLEASITIPGKQPVETPVEEPDKDKKDDKADAPADKKPVIKKITHWSCYGCGGDFTDYDTFKQHALVGARKGELHNYYNWTEEVEVYE